MLINNLQLFVWRAVIGLVVVVVVVVVGSIKDTPLEWRDISHPYFRRPQASWICFLSLFPVFHVCNKDWLIDLTILLICLVIRPPGTAVPDGLMFYRRCIFFSPRILRGPSTDRPETLPHDQNLAVVYNPTPKIQGYSPPKKLGAKNMQNFGQFWTTSDFDCEYLRNGSRYPKSADVTNYGNSSRV